MVPLPSHMHELTATYLLPLSNPLRIQREKNASLEYSAAIGEFKITIKIIQDAAPKIESPDELPIMVATQIQVSVSRKEREEPPPTPTNHCGGRDFAERAQWIGARQKDYENAALLATNRLVKFFKYVQRTPRLRQFSEYAKEFDNPNWTNAAGEAVESGIHEGTAEFLSLGGPTLLGERPFTKDDDGALGQALQTDLGPTPAQEFLSDAQTSIYARNYRRSVLEMAIACEVAIKQAFFKASTPAGSAFESLEDQHKIHVRAIELLHRLALEAFSASFKDEHSREYQHLDYLFRCRNKVAHRASAQYRDDAGIMQAIDRNTLEQWWQSIEILFKWLQSHIGHHP